MSKRLDKLDPDRLGAILAVAAEEFAAHGYASASMNRIIERSGTSKGSMYYYFDDKKDLYATVVRDCTNRIMEAVGPFPPVETVDAFWDQVRQSYERGLTFYDGDPSAVGIIRSLGRAAQGPDLGAVPLADVRERTSGWLQQLIATGLTVGAIRTDLPLDLLGTVVLSMSEGLDLWWAENLPDLSPEARRQTLDTLVGMYRRLATPDDQEHS